MHFAPPCWDEPTGVMPYVIEYVSYLETEVLQRGGSLHREDHEYDRSECCGLCLALTYGVTR